MPVHTQVVERNVVARQPKGHIYLRDDQSRQRMFSALIFSRIAQLGWQLLEVVVFAVGLTTKRPLALTLLQIVPSGISFCLSRYLKPSESDYSSATNAHARLKWNCFKSSSKTGCWFFWICHKKQNKSKAVFLQWDRNGWLAFSYTQVLFVCVKNTLFMLENVCPRKAQDTWQGLWLMTKWHNKCAENSNKFTMCSKILK